jgi:predicted transcriptional regulator
MTKAAEKSKIVEIMKKNSFGAHLATCDGTQPRVRPVAPIVDDDFSLKVYTSGVGMLSDLDSRPEARRGKLNIIVDILTVCKDGALKTEIVYMANLNFKRVDRYIPFLENRHLLEHSGTIYKTTDKGEELLDDYYRMRKLFLP